MKVKSRSRKPVIVRGKEPEEVQDFKYQGSFISADSNIDREVSSRMNRIGSAGVQTAEQHLEVYNCPYQDNIQIYKSSVRLVLLYATEILRTNRRLESRIRGFEGRCL